MIKAPTFQQQTNGSPRRFSGALAAAVALTLGFGSVANAQVSVPGTAIFNAGAGNYAYSYSVINNAAFDLAIVNIPVTTAGNLTNLFAPIGFGISFDPGVGIVSFFEDFDPLTLQTFSPGSTTGLFMFTSTLAPGAATFDALDVVGNPFAGTTLAPGGAVPSALAPLAPITVQVSDLGAIFSTFLSGVPLALAQREVLLNVTRSTTRDVNNRLFRMRARLSDDEPYMGARGPTGGSGDGKSGKQYKNEDIAAERRFELFGSGDFNAFDLEDRNNVNGFGQNVQVGTAGFEFRVNRNFTLGVAASYVNSDTEISRHVGSIDIEGGAVSAYVSGVWQGFYVDALYSYGQFEETISRRTLVGRTARGETDSHNHSIEFNTGYTINLGAVRTGPLASAQYVNGDVDAFNETGGGSAALHYNSQAYKSLITRLGWQLSLPIETRIGKITPQVRASWDRENLNDSERVGLALRNTPFSTISGVGTAAPTVTKGGDFSASASTVAPGRNYLTVGAGVAMELGDRARIILDYETIVFRDDETAHLGSVKVSWAF